MESSKGNKKKQTILIITILITFVGLLMFGLWWSDPNKGKLNPIELAQEKAKIVDKNYTAKSSDSVSAQETWISKSETRLKEIQGDTDKFKNKLSKENSELKSRLEKLEKEMKEQKSNNKNNFSMDDSLPFVQEPADSNVTVTDKVINLPPSITKKPKSIAQSSELPDLPPSSGKRNLYGTNDNHDESVEEKDSGKIFEVSLFDETTDDKEGNKNLNISNAVPVGSYAVVGLVSGMDAPTGSLADKNPVPILLRVLNKGQLPNFFKSDVANCSVTGAGYGDISSERVYIRTEKLSCVLKNGDIAEKNIHGYVAGEDGKAGLRGRLVSKQGSLIAKSFLSGMFSGVGTSIANQYSSVSTSALGAVTSVDPNKAMQSGVATGAGNALEKIADWYLARANETYPIIEIDAKRIGELVLTSTVDFDQEIIGKTNQR